MQRLSPPPHPTPISNGPHLLLENAGFCSARDQVPIHSNSKWVQRGQETSLVSGKVDASMQLKLKLIC